MPMDFHLCRVCAAFNNKIQMIPLLNLFYEDVPAISFINHVCKTQSTGFETSTVCEKRVKYLSTVGHLTDGLTQRYPRHLRYTCAIWISVEDDPGSLVICITCNQVLSSFYIFYKMVELAQERFQQNRPPQEQQRLNNTLEYNQSYTQQVDPLEDGGDLKPDYKGDDLKCENIKCEEKSVDQTDLETNVELQITNHPQPATDLQDIKPVLSMTLQIEPFTNLDAESIRLKNIENFLMTKTFEIKSIEEDEITVSNAHGKFVESRRCYEANQIVLSKYSKDIVIDGNGRWTLERDELNKILPLYVDMQCYKCSSLFTNYNELNDHCYQMHLLRPKFKCCGSNLLHREKLESHILYQHLLKQKPLPRIRTKSTCPVCKKVLYKMNMKQHLSLHLPKEMREFHCDQCDFACGTKHWLIDHKRRTHDATEVSCDQCGKKLKTVLCLKSHMSTAHGSNSREFLCPDCGKRYKTLASCKEHRKFKHSKEQWSKCDLCSKVIKVAVMRHHKNVCKRGEELKQCPQCPFKTKYSLKGHIQRVHEKDKYQFPCQSCSMKFFDETSLLDHTASKHTGIPRYACPYCDKTFMRNGNMYTHCKRMHSEQYAQARLEKHKRKEKNFIEVKDIPTVPSRRRQVVEDVDFVLRNIEELNNKTGDSGTNTQT